MARLRILVVRCCRTRVFIDAIRTIRRQYPDSEIWGLAQEQHHGELQPWLDCFIPYRRRRFGPFRIPVLLLRRIRKRRFDVVVIPYMDSYDADYYSVLEMAAFFAASSVIIIPGGRSIRNYDRKRFYEFVFWNLAKRWIWFDVLLLFGFLIAALLKRKRPPRSDCSEHRKRVLHIIGSLGFGGAQVQLAELVRQTPSYLFDVHILALDHHDDCFFRFRIPSVVQVMHLDDTWPCHSASVWEIMRICRKGRYDIVHNWLFLPSVVGAAGARLAGCARIIISVRNLSLWKRTWNNVWWFRTADALTARIADAVTVNGRALIADHARWALFPKNRIVCVPNGLNPDDFAFCTGESRERLRRLLGLETDALVIGTAGRLAVEKHQELFLQIVFRLKRAGHDLRAVIIGDGPLRPELESIVRRMNLCDCVHFMGLQKESRPLIAGLDLFLLTSRIEGSPNALLEAAFLAVPSLSTDVGAAPDILNHADSVFPVGDVETGFRKAHELLSDLQTSRSRAREVRSWVLRNLTSQRTASAWLALYSGERAAERFLD